MSGEQADYKRGVLLVISFFYFLDVFIFACGSIHQGLELQSVLVMNLEEDERSYKCGCSICRFANKWRCKDID